MSPKYWFFTRFYVPPAIDSRPALTSKSALPVGGSPREAVGDGDGRGGRVSARHVSPTRSFNKSVITLMMITNITITTMIMTKITITITTIIMTNIIIVVIPSVSSIVVVVDDVVIVCRAATLNALSPGLYKLRAQCLTDVP